MSEQWIPRVLNYLIEPRFGALCNPLESPQVPTLIHVTRASSVSFKSNNKAVACQLIHQVWGPGFGHTWWISWHVVDTLTRYCFVVRLEWHATALLFDLNDTLLARVTWIRLWPLRTLNMKIFESLSTRPAPTSQRRDPALALEDSQRDPRQHLLSTLSTWPAPTSQRIGIGNPTQNQSIDHHFDWEDRRIFLFFSFFFPKKNDANMMHTFNVELPCKRDVNSRRFESWKCFRICAEMWICADSRRFESILWMRVLRRFCEDSKAFCEFTSLRRFESIFSFRICANARRFESILWMRAKMWICADSKATNACHLVGLTGFESILWIRADSKAFCEFARRCEFAQIRRLQMPVILLGCLLKKTIQKEWCSHDAYIYGWVALQKRCEFARIRKLKMPFILLGWQASFEKDNWSKWTSWGLDSALRKKSHDELRNQK